MSTPTPPSVDARIWSSFEGSARINWRTLINADSLRIEKRITIIMAHVVSSF